MTQKILLTGAAGGVAARLRPLMRARYGALILSDRVPPDDMEADEEFRPADLDDFEAVQAACSGVDAVVHLGGRANEADWETIRRANIDGMYNMLEASRLAGATRFVFASSNHIAGMYERSEHIGVDRRLRPDSRYGASKAFGEALASLYADKHGMRVLSIRIGNFDPEPRDLRRLSIWIHAEDLMQLVAIGLESDAVRNEIVWGISDNPRAFWDNSEAARLGYSPRHSAETYAGKVLADEAGRKEPDLVSERYQGGEFAAAEYTRQDD